MSARPMPGAMLALAIVGLLTGLQPSRAEALAALERHPFNVLDQVEYDPRSGQIRLVGHYDIHYAGPEIPYLQYLVTLLDNPTPGFSLDPAPGALQAADEVVARIRSEDEWKKVVAEWGGWFDETGYLSQTGRVFLKVFDVQPSNAARGDPWADADRYEILARIFAKAGRERAARIIGVLGKLYRGSPGISPDDLKSLLGAAGASDSFAQAALAVKQGKLNQQQGLATAYRALFANLDREFSLTNLPASRAFEKALGDKPAGQAALEAGLHEFEQQFQTIFRNAVISLWESSKEVHLSLSQVSPSLRGKIRFVPVYLGIDRRSLLAGLMFDADYFLKSIADMPELAKKIPNYRTEFMFESGSKTPAHSAQRFWISVDEVDASRSRDGNILAFAGARMRINMRELDTKSLNDIADQEPGGYEKLLTSLYDEFARLYPQYFHSLREAAKLSYAAQWLKARHARLVLGAIRRAVWNGPDDVAGTVMLRMSPSHSRRGLERSEMSIQGGVSLQAPAPSRTMPADPSVTPAMGRSGCQPGTGGGNAGSIGRSGGSAVLLIDCDDFSRPITFIRDKSLGKGPAKFARPPASTSKAPSSAPQTASETEPSIPVSPSSVPAVSSPENPIIAAHSSAPPPPPRAPARRQAAAPPDCKSHSGTHFFGEAANAEGVDLCDSDAPKVDLSKPVPSLKENDPRKGLKIKGPPAPETACGALSRELVEIADAAHAAALAADSYGTHALAERPPTRGPMGFVVLSDSLPAMRALLPGVSDKTIRELTAPDHSDYRAIVYRDPITQAIHVTFRGTQSSQDWEQGNIPQALGFDSEYYRKAAELGRLLKQAADAEGVRLEIVGHSMGGGMAADATLVAVAQCERNSAIACNVHGITFNAAGLHASSMPKSSLATADRYIDSYVVPGEMLTALQDIRAFPRRYSESVERLLSDIALGIDVANAAPESVGRRTTLPLDWFPRPSILKAVYDWKALLDDVLIPLELHRMRSVRQAILRRSDDLKRQYTTRCALPKVARIALNAVSADPPAPKALQERIDGSVDWNDARRHLQLLKKLRSNTDLTTAERAELAAGSSNFSRAKQVLSDLRRAAPDEMEEVRLLKIPVLRRSLAVAEKDVAGANSTVDNSRDIGMLGSAMVTGDAAARAIASAWAISCPFPNVCPPAMFLLARGLPGAAAELGNTGREAWTLLSERFQEPRAARSIGRNGAPGAGNPPGRADAAAGGEDNAEIALAGAKGIIAGHEAIDGAAKLGAAAGMKAIWTHAHLDAWERIGGGLSALDDWSQFVKQRKMRIKAGQTSWSAEEKQAFAHFFGDAGTALGFKGGGVITAGADVVKGISDFRAARALVAPVAGPANSILRSKLSNRESALSLQRELLEFDAVEPQRPVQASSVEAGAANAESRP